MDEAREPTEFGWYLMQIMASQTPKLSQSDFARVVGVSQSTVSRWIYSPSKPEPEKLGKIADALKVSKDELLYRAGHATTPTASHTRPTASEPAPHPLAVDVRLLLAQSSPVPADERAALEAVLGGVLMPYRKYLRAGRRRTA
jgi:transcriptional regulator with XRE-family HTH domain